MSNLSDITKLRLGLYGPLKTGKTSFALTFPKPLVHLDLDVGFSRASARVIARGHTIMELPRGQAISESLPSKFKQDNWQAIPDIMTKPYQIPLKFPGQRVHGVRAVWEEVIDDILWLYSWPDLKTLVIDTGTVMHQMATMAHLEKAQQTNPERQSLIQIEYGIPNTEERALLNGAYNYDKNMVITHHVGGKYEDRMAANGRMESVQVGETWSGFNGMGNAVDMVCRSHIHVCSQNGKSCPPEHTGRPVPQLWIEDCGLTLAARGMLLDDPTFDSIVEIINQLRLAEATP